MHRGVRHAAAEARWAKSPPLAGEGKIANESLDLAWLRTTKLTPRELDFLGMDPNTPWRRFVAFAANPLDRKLQIEAQTALRGVAAEMVSDDLFPTLFPGKRLVGRQVEMGDSILDFSAVSTDSLGRTSAIEIKGWSGEKWRDALNAWITPAASRTAEQVKLVAGLPGIPIPPGGRIGPLARLRNQLVNGASATTGPPVLGVTSALTKPTVEKLRSFIRSLPPRARPEIVMIPEADIAAAVGRLRASLGLPAKIP